MTQQPAPDYGQPAGYDFSDSRYVQDGYQPGYQAYGESYGQDDGGQPGYGGYAPANQVSYPRLSASLTLDDGSNRSYQLTEGVTVVGRGQDAQFRVPDTGVSRRHVEITWDGNNEMLAELGVPRRLEPDCRIGPRVERACRLAETARERIEREQSALLSGGRVHRGRSSPPGRVVPSPAPAPTRGGA